MVQIESTETFYRLSGAAASAGMNGQHGERAADRVTQEAACGPGHAKLHHQ